MINRLSAHIGYLFKEFTLVERPAAAARQGFKAVEHPAPFDIPAVEMRQRLYDLGLTFSVISSGTGDAAPEHTGLAAIRGCEARFRMGFRRALEYAEVVGCPYIHVMAGSPNGGRLDAEETYKANIGWAVEACAGSGTSVLVEAISLPGYHLRSLSHAAELQDDFSGRLSLLFDTFHAASQLIDPADWIAEHADRIGHIHIADHPGRHEPGTGAVDFEAVLSALAYRGYRGAIGFEYMPSTATPKSIDFLQEWKRLPFFAQTSVFQQE